MKKRFGDTKTKLTLTDKAQRFYNQTDPINIYEREDGLYDIDGFSAAEGLTAEEVNTTLEAWMGEI